MPFQSMCKIITRKMFLLRNFGQIILVIASVATSNEHQNCIYFEGEGGYVQLLPTPVVNNNSVLSMEVQAYHCDAISLTIHNGKNYRLTLHTDGLFYVDDGTISTIKFFNVQRPCTGLWNEVKLVLTTQKAFLDVNRLITYHHRSDYDLNTLLDAFRDNSLYVGVHLHKTIYRSFDRPIEGLIRNIRFDDRLQSIDQRRLNGTLVAKACPKDLLFASNAGAAQLSENVTFNDNFRIFFELKITDCPECCTTSALLLSAISEDSYFILEIADGILYSKMKAQNGEDVRLSSIFDFDNYPLCNGKWHKIGFLQQDGRSRLIAEAKSWNFNFSMPFNFSAPLYIGQHPIFKLLSAVEVRNGFKGCFRSLRFNGVAPEIIDSNLNEFVKLGSCSQKNILV